MCFNSFWKLLGFENTKNQFNAVFGLFMGLVNSWNKRTELTERGWHAFSYLHGSGVSCGVGAHLEESSLCRSGLTSLSGRSSLVHHHGLSSKHTHEMGRLFPLHHPHLVHKRQKLKPRNHKTAVNFAKHLMRYLWIIPKVCATRSHQADPLVVFFEICNTEKCSVCCNVDYRHKMAAQNWVTCSQSEGLCVQKWWCRFCLKKD